MRYESKRPSGVDKDIEIYTFSFGIEELRVLKAILSDFRKRVPIITETTTIRARVRNMIKNLERFSREEKRKI